MDITKKKGHKAKGTNTNPVTIIEDKLYWTSDKKPPKFENATFYFCVDDSLIYIPFLSDFGPLNISQIYRFITELKKVLRQQEKKGGHALYHYTSTDTGKKANAALLMCSFMVKPWNYF